MIKPSDEMVAAYKAARRAYWQALDWTTQGKTVAEREAEASRAGLAAVLALVERDYDDKVRDYIRHAIQQHRDGGS